MYVRTLSVNPRCGKSPTLCFVRLVAILLCSAITAGAQVKSPKGYPGKPPWADTATESNIYPVGDAIGVYTAVLDLYFTDGPDRPSIIVMHDTAESRRGGPCIMQCPEAWLHKSRIDPSTELGFAKLSPKRPKMVPFGYPIPIDYLSYDQSNQLRLQGDKILQAQHKPNGGTGEDFLSALSKKFPGVWGFMTLSKVGFNDAHSEALISVDFFCGVVCRSEENLFLKKIDKRWVVVERIPNDVDGLVAWAGMRYRGPTASKPGDSELLADVTSRKAEGDDARAVYAAVLDSLYTFHGEFPRRIVITDWFAVDADSYDSLPHKSAIEASALARYKFLGGVRAPLYSNLKLRAPVAPLPRDSLSVIENLGKPLEKIALDRQLMTETSPFWLGFRLRYPGAWGMVGFTRVAFNDARSQALVFTSHTCGANCRNDDTWVVKRLGETWQIAERIPRGAEKNWQLDSLRYLGTDASPRMYEPRRIQGSFVSKATGAPLRQLRFTAYVSPDSVFMKTDRDGRFELTKLPAYGAVRLSVSCQRQPVLPGPPSKYSSRTQDAGEVLVHPGTDSTVHIKLDLTHCLLGRRLHPLESSKPLPQALASGYPDAIDAAVYRGVLDELYGLGGRVLLRPLVHRLWEYQFESELFRLEKQGVVDSTLGKRLSALPKDSVWIRPGVAFGRKVVVFGPAEQKWLEEQAADISYAGEKRDFSLLGMVKEAYPGADRILSFSRIGYNEALNQAVVQVVVNSAAPYDRGETMLLRKQRSTWKVVRRHLENEDTSGELVAGRCEPVDAVPTPLRVDQLERFVGDADITVIPTSPMMRKYAGTSRYRFTATDTLHRYYWVPSEKGDTRAPRRMEGQQKIATVQSFDSAGKPGRYPGELMFRPGGSSIAFYEPNTLDGWYEEFTILRINGRQFFGKWKAEPGPAYPFKGYFCGRLR